MKRVIEIATSRKTERFFWVLFLVSLPVTSFPWLPGVVGGSTTVRPLAIYPLAVLLAIVVVRRLLHERLPKSFLPLLLFVIVVVISGAVAAVQPVPEFRFATPLDRVIRNLLTLALGISFYFSTALIPRTRKDVDIAIRWLLLAFCLPLFWSSLQAFYVLWIRDNPVFWEPYFDKLNMIHHVISIRNLQETRVTGLAYEPSWFAEQLSILVLPWLLTAVMTRRSFFNQKAARFLVEDGLLAWTVVMMFLTYSRTGLVIMLVQFVIAVLLGSGRAKGEEPRRLPRLFSPGSRWGRVGLLAVILMVFVAGIFTLGSQNRYFSRMWRYFTEADASGNYWAYIAFGQRFVYWEAALNMYETRPVLGVGVGNFALHFESALPDIRLYQYPEILDLIVPEKGQNELVTPKNLFLRILAETGLVGLGLYLSFLAAVVGEAIGLLLDRTRDAAFITWGRAFVLGLVGAFLAAFSTDSFAMPTIWVFLGIITAAARIKSLEEVDQGRFLQSKEPRIASSK